jgi:hypothetical protein
MLEDAIVPAAAALGLLHGLNPTAGWLFALYRALWCKSLKELLASVSVVGLGHIAASTLIAAPIVLLSPLPSHIAPVTSAGLIAISAYRLTRPRHRYLGMRAGYPLLAAIGALFALLHGSALSIAPLVSYYCSIVRYLDLAAASALSLIMIHNLAALLSMFFISILVFLLGLKALKRVWINYDLLSNATFLAMGIFLFILQIEQWVPR